jgi:hypothetical protein
MLTGLLSEEIANALDGIAIALALIDLLNQSLRRPIRF